MTSTPRESSTATSVVTSTLLASGRAVTVTGGPGGGVLAAVWAEREEQVAVTSLGLDADELLVFVASLQPVDPGVFDALEVDQVVGPCLDDQLLVAPDPPPGWQLFVLQVQPVGACTTGPVVMASVVQPGLDADRPGKLATVVVTLGATPAPDVNALDWDGRDVTVGPSNDTGLGVQFGVSFAMGNALVSVGGTGVSLDEMREIVSRIQPVDSSTWQALIESVATPPTT